MNPEYSGRAVTPYEITVHGDDEGVIRVMHIEEIRHLAEPVMEKFLMVPFQPMPTSARPPTLDAWLYAGISTLTRWEV